MVESMLEVVESLLALLRSLLAVVERLLAPSFCVSAKIRASRRAWSPTKKYSKDETTHRGFGTWRGPACALVCRVGCEVRLSDTCVPCVCPGSPPGPVLNCLHVFEPVHGLSSQVVCTPHQRSFLGGVLECFAGSWK